MISKQHINIISGLYLVHCTLLSGHYVQLFEYLTEQFQIHSAIIKMFYEHAARSINPLASLMLFTQITSVAIIVFSIHSVIKTHIQNNRKVYLSEMQQPRVSQECSNSVLDSDSDGHNTNDLGVIDFDTSNLSLSSNLLCADKKDKPSVAGKPKMSDEPTEPDDSSSSTEEALEYDDENIFVMSDEEEYIDSQNKPLCMQNMESRSIVNEFDEEKPSDIDPELATDVETFNYFIDSQKAKSSIESVIVADNSANLEIDSEVDHDSYALNGSLECVKFDQSNPDLDILVNSWPELASEHLNLAHQLETEIEIDRLELTDLNQLPSSLYKEESIVEVEIQLERDNLSEVASNNHQVEMYGLLDQIYGMKLKYPNHKMNVKKYNYQDSLDTQYELL